MRFAWPCGSRWDAGELDETKLSVRLHASYPAESICANLLKQILFGAQGFAWIDLGCPACRQIAPE
jgi:hypothetical protein